MYPRSHKKPHGAFRLTPEQKQIRKEVLDMVYPQSDHSLDTGAMANSVDYDGANLNQVGPMGRVLCISGEGSPLTPPAPTVLAVCSP